MALDQRRVQANCQQLDLRPDHQGPHGWGGEHLIQMRLILRAQVQRPADL